MRRESFGPLAALSDDDLARALVIIGGYRSQRLFPKLSELVKRYPKRFAWREESSRPKSLEFTIRVSWLQDCIRRLSKGLPLWPTSDVKEEVKRRWGSLSSDIALSEIRYRLDLTDVRNNAGQSIDLDWLAALLARPSVNALSVVLSWPSEPLHTFWDWPLRVVVAKGPASASFIELVARGSHRNLFTIRTSDDSGDSRTDCDVLIFPSNLHDAARMALDLPKIRAAAVIVTGRLDVPWPQAWAWLNSLRRQFSVGAIACAFVPRAEHGLWFQSLIEELSHNETLDVALFQTSKKLAAMRQHLNFESLPRPLIHPTSPLIAAERQFLDVARLSRTAERLGTAAASISDNIFVNVMHDLSPPDIPLLGLMPLREAGTSIARNANQILWARESGSASSLVEFRKGIEEQIGVPFELPGINLESEVSKTSTSSFAYTTGGGKSEQLPSYLSTSAPVSAFDQPLEVPATPILQMPSKPIDARYVQAVLWETGVEEQSTVFKPFTVYRTDINVGPTKADSIVANEILDERLLPRSTIGHDLKIVFSPLWKLEGATIEPQVSRIHLPISGESSTARFHFQTPMVANDIRARIVVLHENRVLQTVLLRCAEPDATGNGRAVLEVENVVSKDFGQQSIAPAFEGALIVNDSAAGVLGLTAISGERAIFFEPEGIATLLNGIRAELSELNAPDDQEEDMVIGLDEPRIHKLLFRLALKGSALAKELKRQPQLGPFMKAYRLQIVEAVSGAFLPVELIYDGKPPLPHSTRCPNSVGALENQTLHDQCPNRGDENFYCPAAFWGFSRCIERQPAQGQPGHVFSQPLINDNTLRPLKRVLLATSERVRPVDMRPPTGLKGILAEAGLGFSCAVSWNQWTTIVAAESPSLLLLLPHSLLSKTQGDLPALEISGDEKAAPYFDASYVQIDPALHPIVFLLGCSTALPDIPFLKFTTEFRVAGASVIIGTLATIRARQTIAFVKEMLEQLRAVASEKLPFDEALLRVKRRMLAKGDPFVLSLLAYGDTGWRIQL